MIRALSIAATGMKAQQTNIDVISNNLANVNTTGFKRGRADFEDMLYQRLRPVGASATATTDVPTGIYLGMGSRLSSTSKVFGQGAGKFTENWTDIAIEGEGFFQIQLPNGDTAYTRNGAFKINAQGMLVTQKGNPVLPNITVPQNVVHDTVEVGLDGTVSYRVGGVGGATAQAGQIQLARFINPAGLEAIGGNLLLESIPSGPPQVGTPNQDGFGATAGATLEMSNVNIVDELVGMIFAQRAYEINSKSIRVADEMLETAVNVKR